MSEPEQIRVALTGATGALGSAVLEELDRRGWSCRALVRPRDGRSLPELDAVTWVEGHLEDRASLDELVTGTDAILHAAYCPMEETPRPGWTTAEHFVQANVVGALRLLERTPATRLRRMIFVSSLAVYGPNPQALPGSDRVPLDEDFPVWPREFYGGHKAALERMVVAASGEPGMDTSVFRLGCVLGRYRDVARDPLHETVREAVENGAIRTRKGAYALTAADAARVLVGALADSRARGRVFNTFDRWLDFAELAGPLSVLLGREIEVACAAAPAPDPPLRNDRLAELGPRWTTEQSLPELLRELAARV